MKALITLILTLAVCQAAVATKVYKVPVAKMYGESEVVIYGRIETGRTLGNDCGVEYSVRVASLYKGTAKPGDLLIFQNDGPTQVGADYFLFLSSTANEFTPIVSTNSGAMNMRSQYIKRCKDKRPPLVVNVYGNGALKTTGTYRQGMTRAVLIDDFALIPPDGIKVTKLKQSDRYDNDRLDAAMDVQQFTNYIKTLAKRN